MKICHFRKIFLIELKKNKIMKEITRRRKYEIKKRAKSGKLVVLSLFDGISGAQIALKELGIVPAKYFASEVLLIMVA